MKPTTPLDDYILDGIMQRPDASRLGRMQAPSSRVGSALMQKMPSKNQSGRGVAPIVSDSYSQKQ